MRAISLVLVTTGCLFFSACGADAPASRETRVAGETAASREELAEPTGGGSQPPRGGTPVMPTGGPDRHACAADTDCVAGAPGPHPSSDDPCCTGYPSEHVSRSYAAWAQQWRAAHCGGPHDCAPLPPPAPPAECFFAARCVAGRCTHACGP